MIRVTVDGGTNRWLNFIRKHNLQDKLPPPELITGDLDSCRKESLAFFNASTVVETPDQNATDFTKSLQVLEPYIVELSLDSVVAVCETSGRIDHIHANENSEWLQLTVIVAYQRSKSETHSLLFSALQK